jgi:hypothetical protein
MGWFRVGLIGTGAGAKLTHDPELPLEADGIVLSDLRMVRL